MDDPYCLQSFGLFSFPPQNRGVNSKCSRFCIASMGLYLVVPFARSATMQTRSFSVVGPKTWNGLPADLRHLPKGACSQFHHLLKTVLISAWPGSGASLSIGILKGRYINFE